MIIYCIKTFNSFVDFKKIVNNFEFQVVPFIGTIDIIDCTIKDYSLLAQYEIKFKFECEPSNAIRCENYLHGYIYNLLGESY